MSYNSVLFLQEIHSSSKDEIKWKDKFKGEVFFWHGKTNSRGVLIGYTGKRSFIIKKKKDENGHFLILKAIISDSVFILINLHHPNTEKKAGFYMGKTESNAANI